MCHEFKPTHTNTHTPHRWNQTEDYEDGTEEIGKNAIFVYNNWTYTIYYKRSYFQFKFQLFLYMFTMNRLLTVSSKRLWWISVEHCLCPFLYLSIYPSIYLFIYLSLKFLYVSRSLYQTFFVILTDNFFFFFSLSRHWNVYNWSCTTCRTFSPCNVNRQLMTAKKVIFKTEQLFVCQKKNEIFEENAYLEL